MSEVQARAAERAGAFTRAEKGLAAGAARVERLVAKRHGVSLSELTAAGRPTARVAWARHTAMYLQRVLLELSCEEIGRRFRHHRTSVIHACRKIEDRRDETSFDRRLQRLEDRILQDLAASRS